MASYFRKLAFSVATACFALTLGATPALAKTHHKHHAKAHHSRAHTKISASRTIVRIAQTHLSNLGYYTGKIDGLMGPKTRAAIKQFQREHSLKADGVLGPKTNRALAAADPRPADTSLSDSMLFLEAAPVPNQSVNPDYVSPLNGGTKIIPSRFATLDVSESGGGTDKRYSVSLNGQPVLLADAQPSIIGISSTYDLGNEDAVVFTTYTQGDSTCVYRTHILVLDSTGSKMLDVENCTRNYQARVDNGMLFLSFPEPDDNRAVGATWRLEGVSLEKL